MWKWLHSLEEWLIATLLAVMTLITFVQVVARYVFNYSFVWAHELVVFLFAWLIFLGMAYGVRTGSHIGIDAVVKLLGARTARVVTIVAAALCLTYAGLMLYGSWNYITRIYQIGNLAKDLPIPVWIPRLALPAGFALLTFRFGQVLFGLVTGRTTAHLVGSESEDALKLHAEFDTTREIHRP